MLILNKKTEIFTEAYNDYYPIVFSSVYSKIRNRDIAKDITQEVFIRFYEKFDEIENTRKWLFGALKYVIIEYFRNKNEKQEDIEKHFQDISMTYVNGFRDTRHIIEEALNHLDNFKEKHDKILFELIAIHDFSYKSAAKQIGMTEHQSRYRYNLIVKKLLLFFQKKGIKSLDELL